MVADGAGWGCCVVGGARGVIGGGDEAFDDDGDEHK
jgi:hypothetical protein